MELILLAALGLGALSLVFGGDDAAPGRSDAPDRDNGDDTDPPDDTAGNVIELSSGVPNPEGTSGNDTFSGIVEGSVRGGAGSDRFSFDNGYGAVISGGAGNDSFVGGMGDGFTLYGEAGNDLFAFDTDVFDGAVAYGGAGNDRFDLDFSDSDVQPGATLSGGDGADIYDLTFSPGMADRAGGGKMVTIKDFKLGEDQLNVTFTDLDRAELVENSDGNYSDLNLHYITTDDAGATVDRYMRLRLEGITGATLESLGLNLPEVPPDEPPTNLLQVSDGATINGSIQADVFSLSDAVDGDFTAELNGGAGDDTFNLTRPDGSAFLISGSLDGGAGNDYFDVSGERTNLRGGEGNDTVYGDLLGGSVYGEGGDDLLRISAGPSDPVFVYGGEGKDTLNGSGSDNIVLEGGAGDDVIVTDGAASRGTGYNIIARGGAGDDTMSHSVDIFPPHAFLNDVPARLTGGSGADAFNINLTIGEGTFEASADDPEVFTTPAGLLEDFQRGTDSLTIDLSAIDDVYSAVSARMIENADNGTTDIILGLSDNTNPPNNIVIRVVATGISWDDVTFSGRDPTFLNAA